MDKYEWKDTGLFGKWGRIYQNFVTGEYAEEGDYQYMVNVSTEGKVAIEAKELEVAFTK